MNCDFPVLGIDLVFHVLSGLAIPGTPPIHKSLPTNDHLARAGNGICVYHCAVEDPNLPLATMFRFRVVCGYISFSGFRFTDICGFKDVNVDSSLQSYDLRGEAPIHSIQTVAQETENETRLEMAYLVHHLNETAQPAAHWLHLPLIFRKLQKISKDLVCAGNCPAMYKVWQNTLYVGIPIDEWPLRINIEVYCRTQKMLSGCKHGSDTWIVLSSSGLFTIITGQPVLLYALISQSSLCLLPFKDCLTCIMRIGTDLHVYKRQVVDSPGREDLGIFYRETAKSVRLNPFSETTISWEGATLEAYLRSSSNTVESRAQGTMSSFGTRVMPSICCGSYHSHLE